MQRAPWASNGPNHLGLCTLQVLFTWTRPHLLQSKLNDGPAAGGAVKSAAPPPVPAGKGVCGTTRSCRQRRGGQVSQRFSCKVAFKFYTNSGEKVWEGCGKMSKGLEGPKSHDTGQQNNTMR